MPGTYVKLKQSLSIKLRPNALATKFRGAYLVISNHFNTYKLQNLITLKVDVYHHSDIQPYDITNDNNINTTAAYDHNEEPVQKLLFLFLFIYYIDL